MASPSSASAVRGEAGGQSGATSSNGYGRRSAEGAPGRRTPTGPVHVVTHSLVGVIGFHTATAADAGRQLWIDGFVTFGSRSSLLHLIHPRERPICRREGNPVVVSPSSGGRTCGSRWTTWPSSPGSGHGPGPRRSPLVTSRCPIHHLLSSGVFHPRHLLGERGAIGCRMFIGLDMSQEAKGHGGWWGGDPFGRCIRTARSGSILQDCTQQKTGGST